MLILGGRFRWGKKKNEVRPLYVQLQVIISGSRVSSCHEDHDRLRRDMFTM